MAVILVSCYHTQSFVKNSGDVRVLTFILAIIAGFSTPYIEPVLIKILQPRLTDVPVNEGEYQTITFVLLLIAVATAAIVSGLLASAFTVLFGGALGLFGMRLFKILRALVDGQSGDLDED
tara:strand:- start:120 stop:482 length:363 start_codon:yes stop_codon:yes gene_type:complete